jgi:signal transduction histidine kinase
MLHEFLTSNRDEILRRTRAMVAARMAPQPTHEELSPGIPRFLDELIATLGGWQDRAAVMKRDATHHGERRQQTGFTVAHVVQDYGDLCQVVTHLAMERPAPVSAEEFCTLNRCMDDAIAHAVTEHVRLCEWSASNEESKRLGFLAHELRNSLHTAILCYEVLKTGTVGMSGTTGTVLGRSLASLRLLVDRTLSQVRLHTDVDHRERVEISPFLEEVEATGVIASKEHDVSLSVERGDAGVAVRADRHLLGSAVSNLLQNAFKFTRQKGHVSLRTSTTPASVVIEIEDQCGGLRPGEIDDLLARIQRSGREKSGLGLGLAISKRAIETVGGTLRVRNRPDIGCVFTIDLPRLREPVPS